MDDAKLLTEEDKHRCLDFAKRLCFVGYDHLTQARRDRLWYEAEGFLADALAEGHTSWETKSPDGLGCCTCDWFSERFSERYIPLTGKWADRLEKGDYPQFFDTLEAICRAAFDVVDDFAGGVWGFTLGDIRRMYDGTLPDWIPTDWYLDDTLVDLATLPDEVSICI